MKVSIVTGGAHGIGQGIAFRLMNEGNHVIILDNQESYMDELRKGKFGHLDLVPCDVGNPDEVSGVMDMIGNKYGQIHNLVNNAGISTFKSIDSMSVDDWNRMISVNLSSVFYMVKFGKRLLSDHSAIVNIASTRAFMSEPDGEAYGASKGGIVALTHALAISLGPKTRVNCISPGWIDIAGDALTEADHVQHPCGRVGIVDDIAGMVAFLLGEEAGFITGQNFMVDGGMTRKMIYV